MAVFLFHFVDNFNFKLIDFAIIRRANSIKIPHFHLWQWRNRVAFVCQLQIKKKTNFERLLIIQIWFHAFIIACQRVRQLSPRSLTRCETFSSHSIVLVKSLFYRYKHANWIKATLNSSWNCLNTKSQSIILIQAHSGQMDRRKKNENKNKKWICISCT